MAVSSTSVKSLSKCMLACRTRSCERVQGGMGTKNRRITRASNVLSITPALAQFVRFSTYFHKRFIFLLFVQCTSRIQTGGRAKTQRILFMSRNAVQPSRNECTSIIDSISIQGTVTTNQSFLICYSIFKNIF